MSAVVVVQPWDSKNPILYTGSVIRIEGQYVLVEYVDRAGKQRVARFHREVVYEDVREVREAMVRASAEYNRLQDEAQLALTKAVNEIEPYRVKGEKPATLHS